MSALECLPIRAEIYIPENKRSVFVHKKGKEIQKDRDKEYQGVWVVDGYTPDKKKETTELWIFADDDELGIDRQVLENNPLQGRWGYAPHVDLKKATKDEGIDPKDMWFFPPKSAKCKIPPNMEEYIHRGTWVKPTFKRDFSQLGSNKAGFLTVSGDMRIAKGEKHSVTGKWNMMGFNDDVVRGRKKEPADDPEGKGAYQIYVRKVNGVRFPIHVIPGNKIMQCKKKIHQKKGILIEDQRLTFNDVPLKDEKTVIGSGIRNGDTIDLNPMIIYVRNVKGKKFTFEVDPDEMVEDIKKMVQKREGTPVEKQRLYFKHWKLVEGKPISHFKIRHKSTLDLRGMMIYVQPIGDVPKIELEVEPTDPLKSIKVKVKSRINVPVAEQCLFFQEKEMLEDAATLANYQVQHLDTLFLRDNSSHESGMIIFVIKDWDKYKFQLTVEPNNTILDVKKLIKESEGISVNKQRLTFKGKSVYNAKTLQQSKIKNRSILHLEAGMLESQNPDYVNVVIKPGEKPRAIGKSPKKPIATGLPSLTVMTPSGDIPVPFDPKNDTIKDIKKKVGKELGIPPKDFKVQPTGKKNPKPLKNTDKPQPGDVLSMVPPKPILSPHVLKVSVPSMSGPHIFDLDVEPNDILDDVKAKIAKIAGLPVKDLHLLDNSNIVESSESPNKYDTLQVAPLIDVVLPDQTKVKVPVLPGMTFGDLKNTVKEKTGIPNSKQRLFFMDKEDEELGDTLPLATFDITPAASLGLKYPEIQVRDPKGRSFALTIDPHDSPDTTKAKIAARLGVPAKELHLIQDDEEVPEDYVPSHNHILDIAPEIDVQIPNHSKVRLTVLPNMNLEDAKTIIEEETGIPKEKQRIFFFDGDGKEIPSSVPLSKLGVNQDSVLEVLPPEEEITINTPDGRSFMLLVDPLTDSTTDIRRKAATKLNVHVKDLKLFLDGNELDDQYKPSRTHIIDLATQIEVNLPDNRKTCLSILPAMTVDAIKDVIEVKTGTPKANQRLFFFDSDKELQNVTLASEAGILPGKALEMKPVEDCEIALQLPDGRSFFLVVDPISETADNIRRKVAAKLGISVKSLPPLVHDGDDLSDHYRPSKGDILAIDAPIVDVELPDQTRVHLAVMRAKQINNIADVVEEISENGRNFTLIVDPDEPLKMVKQKIRKKIGFPVGNLRIGNKVWGEEEDNITLEEAGGARAGCVLAADPPEVEISLPNNQKVMLKILPTMTVKEVKEMVALQAPEFCNGDQKGRMFFLDNDSELDDNTTFSKLEFNSGQKIEIRSFILNVRHWDGRIFTIDAQTDWYIEDLKEGIGNVTKLLPGNQRLSFQGKPVVEDMQLLKQGIYHKATLNLESMCIRVQTPINEKPLVLDVEDSDLVEEVKRRALRMSKAAMDDPFLVFGGITLLNGKTLSHYSIQHNDLLLLEEYRISILLWDGETCMLNGIKQNDNIAKVQKRLQRDHGMPTDQQKLSFSGRRLDGSSTLVEEGISHRAVLVLEPKDFDIELPNADKKTLKHMKKKKFSTQHDDIWPVMPDWNRRIFFFDNDENFDAFIELTVLHWSGKKYLLQDILPSMKTLEVKEMISKLSGTNKKLQQLKFNGNLLKDKKSLLDQGVGHKSVLTLVSPKKNTIASPDLDRVLLDTLPAKLVSEISITVKHWNGDVSHLNPDPHEYIDDIKERLADRFSMPVEHQRLVFQGKPTSDHLNLKEQDIVDGSILELVPMEILVKVPSKKKPYEVVVEPDYTIAKVKKSLAKKVKVQVELQCIMFGGEELDSSRTIDSYAIEHGDVLVLEVFKIRVVHWSGDQFELDGLGPGTTVYEAKEAIWRLRKVPTADQKLVFKGNTLNDVLCLRDQGVTHRSVLFLHKMEDSDSTAKEHVKTKVSFRFFNSAGAVDPLKPSSFPLEIKLWDGKTFSVDASPLDYLDDVKDKIFAKEQIPLDYQLLHHNDRPLAFDLNLEEQGIQKGSSLCLVHVSISVKLPSEEVVDLHLSYKDTIKKAKKLLKDKSKIPLKDQFLMMGGKELNDAMRVCDYGIDSDDTLLLETFTLKVADWDGNFFEVTGLCPGDGVLDLKARITELKGTYAGEQVLNFNGTVLNNVIALKDQGLKHRSVVVMEPPDDRSMSPVKEKMSFRFLSSALEHAKDTKVSRPQVLCLHIKHSNGDMFIIKAEPSDYVEDVKEKISCKKNLPVDRQRLKFEGVVLDDCSTLESLGICDGSILHLGMMELQVHVPDGKEIVVEVDCEDTVIRLKRRLKDLTGISVDSQFLMTGGQLMESSKKLDFYGLKHGDSIELERFKVCVVDWNGNVNEVDGLQPSSNVSDMKKWITKTKGIQSSQQTLTANGQKLSEFLRLKDQGLTHRAVVVLETENASLGGTTKLGSVSEEVDEMEGINEKDNYALSPFAATTSKKKAIGGKKKNKEDRKTEKGGKTTTDDSRKAKKGKRTKKKVEGSL